ncbi:MAG: hypothetical protein AAGA93_22205, partial [Actinomycetota bacterium]
MVATRRMEVNGFGPWRATLDGRPIGRLPSRTARELMLWMSLNPGVTARRDRLASDLWPNESDLAAARKRLSQELSRIQSAAGARIWNTTRDWVRVDDGAVITSDVGAFLDAARPDRIGANVDIERKRVATALALVDDGEVLPGHESEWADSLRTTVARAEVRLLQHLVSLDGDVASEESLAAATRWAELEPYSDAANAAVAASLTAIGADGPAARYVEDVGRRYADELGVELPPDLARAADDPSGGAVHPVWARIGALETACAADRHRTDDERIADLLELDGLLRQTGHHPRRRRVIDDLVDAGAPSAETTWRRAEVAFVALEDQTARSLIDDHRRQWGDDDRLTLIESHLGDPDEHIVQQLARLMSTSNSPEIRMDAALRLARVSDLRLELGAAEARLLDLSAMAETAGSVYYRAAAACDLGWNRIRVADNAIGETYLREGLALADQVGADSLRASAHGGLGFLYHEHQRPASSARHIALAADLSQLIGDIRAEIRWRSNLAIASLSLGDLASVEAQATRLQAMMEMRSNLRAEWTVTADQVAIYAHEIRGDREAALKLSERLIEDASASGVRSLVRSGKTHAAAHLLSLGRAEEALAVCSALLIDPEPQSGAFVRVIRSIQGCCLVASGQPQAGYQILSELAEANTASLNNLELVLCWLIRASSMLGDHERERAAAIRGRRYLQTIRADLTDEQWPVMLNGNHEIGALHAEVNRILG